MALFDLLVPSDCAGCGRPGGPACAACRRALSTPALRWRPRPEPAGLPPTWTVAEYDGSARALLLAYKERGAGAVLAALGPALAVAIAAAAGACRDGLVVVPVPSAPRAVRARGDDVVLRLVRRAGSLARRRGLRLVVLPALRHTRVVADSAGLGAQARRANLAGAFGVPARMSARIAGAPVVVADDLLTTGATLTEAARALRERGAVVLGAATVAATHRHDAKGVLGGAPVGFTVRRLRDVV